MHTPVFREVCASEQLYPQQACSTNDGLGFVPTLQASGLCIGVVPQLRLGVESRCPGDVMVVHGWIGGRGVLEHPSRKRLTDLVIANPGVCFRELARQAGLAAGTCRHHLTKLVLGGVVVESRVGCRQVFQPAALTEDPVRLKVLREEGMREVVAFVATQGRVCQREVLEALPWPRSTTQHRLSRLALAGVVSIREQGRLKFYEVAA